MYSYDRIVCITNRHLCTEDFTERIAIVAGRKPAMIIVREKDLSPFEYRKLFEKLEKAVSGKETMLVPHYFIDEAMLMGIDRIHLPLHVAVENSERLKNFKSFGVSVHSRKDAKLAERLGADYVIAGHVFETDCKKGLEGRGLDFVREICSSFRGPVFAIGGIDFENMDSVIDAGADRVCMMSELMQGSL